MDDKGLPAKVPPWVNWAAAWAVYGVNFAVVAWCGVRGHKRRRTFDTDPLVFCLRCGARLRA